MSTIRSKQEIANFKQFERGFIKLIVRYVGEEGARAVGYMLQQKDFIGMTRTWLNRLDGVLPKSLEEAFFVAAVRTDGQRPSLAKAIDGRIFFNEQEAQAEAERAFKSSGHMHKAYKITVTGD